MDYGFMPPQKCPKDIFGGDDLTTKCLPPQYRDDVNEMGPTKSDLVYGPGTSGMVITDEELAEEEAEKEGNDEDDEQLWRPPPPPPPPYAPLKTVIETPSEQYKLKGKDAPKGKIQMGGAERGIADFVSDPAWFVVKANAALEVMSAKGDKPNPLDIGRGVGGVMVLVDPKKGKSSSQKYVQELMPELYGRGRRVQCICVIQRGGADPVAVSKLSAALMAKGADKVIMEGGIISFGDDYRSGGFSSAFSGTGGSVYIA